MAPGRIARATEDSGCALNGLGAFCGELCLPFCSRSLGCGFLLWRFARPGYRLFPLPHGGFPFRCLLRRLSRPAYQFCRLPRGGLPFRQPLHPLPLCDRPRRGIALIALGQGGRVLGLGTLAWRRKLFVGCLGLFAGCRGLFVGRRGLFV
jgi:hypothetical protein